jgi:hypothetical protein
MTEEETLTVPTFSVQTSEKTEFDEDDYEYPFVYYKNEFPTRDQEIEELSAEPAEGHEDVFEPVEDKNDLIELTEENITAPAEGHRVEHEYVFKPIEDNSDFTEPSEENITAPIEGQRAEFEDSLESAEANSDFTESTEGIPTEPVEGHRVEMIEYDEAAVVQPEYESDMQRYADTTTESIVQQANGKMLEIVDRPSDVEMQFERAEENTVDGFDNLNDLDEIFRNNIEITPFDTKTEDVQWVRISLREPIFLSIDYRSIANHPLIIAAYKKYNHLILGQTTNNGRIEYILGVPGIFESQYVNTLRQLGFTQFKTVVDSGVLRPGDYGYWLCPMLKHY